jgi:hypothetical protein
MGGPNAGNPLAPRHTKLRYATRRKFVQKFNKDLNALRTHLFHAIRQHATRRGTTFARSNRPDFLVSVLSRASLLLQLQPRSRDFDTSNRFKIVKKFRNYYVSL